MTGWVIALLVALVLTGMGLLAWLFTTAAMEVSIQRGIEAAGREERDAVEATVAAIKLAREADDVTP